MEAKMKLVLSIFVIFSFYCNTCCVLATVPVLIWGQDSTVKDVPVVPAGHTLSSDGLTKVVENLVKDPQQNIVVFLQNKLSLDDITAHADVYNAASDGSAYHNLKNLMQTKPSTHIPRVVSPDRAIRSLREKYSDNTHIVTEAPYSLDNLPLSDDEANLILVHLPDVSDNQEKLGASLKQIDDIIGSVATSMENRGKDYNALYTAMESSKVEHQHLNLGRHLLAANANASNTHEYYIPKCILFYAGQITLKIKGNTTAPVTVANGTADGTCSNITQLNVKFSNANFTELSMLLTFQKTSDGFWSVETWNLTYELSKGSPNKTTVSFGNTQEIYAPLNDSYHCSKPHLSKGGVTLDITELQVQAISVPVRSFGRANDCVGFFTIPIWSGIISCLILLSILTFGLMLLANITTMDRFDDPKGKTITVNVGE